MVPSASNCGNSSLGFNQKKYTIELRDEQGGDVEAPLLGMPAHSDWVLLAPYSDVSAVRDPLAFQLWRDMGHWGPRTRLVELTLNGEYRGIYISQHIAAEHIISAVSEAAPIFSEQTGQTVIISEHIVFVIIARSGSVGSSELLVRIRSSSASG